jgi:hypothetical protein
VPQSLVREKKVANSGRKVAIFAAVMPRPGSTIRVLVKDVQRPVVQDVDDLLLRRHVSRPRQFCISKFKRDKKHTGRPDYHICGGIEKILGVVDKDLDVRYTHNRRGAGTDIGISHFISS